jgi:hypothetical protein
MYLGQKVDLFLTTPNRLALTTSEHNLQWLYNTKVRHHLAQIKQYAVRA